MNQDSRSLIAIGLSVAALVAWYSFFSPKQKPQAPVDQQARTEQVENTVAQKAEVKQTAKKSAKELVADPQAGVAVKQSIIDTPLYDVVLSSNGGVPLSWKMKNFQGNGKGAGPVELVSEGSPPLIENISIDSVPDRPNYRVVEEGPEHIVYSWTGGGLAITKEYKFNPSAYQTELIYTIRNVSKRPIATFLSLAWEKDVPKEEKRGFLGFLKGPQNQFNWIYYLDGKRTQDAAAGKEGKLLWAGIEDRYFISALIPRGHGDTATITTESEALSDGGRRISTAVGIPTLSIPVNGEAVRTFSIYAGPKEMENLKAVGVSLEKAIDYGWFSFIAVPILYILQFCYKIIHNWGVAIIILTVLVKLLLNPLTHHSMKSMKAMQVLQPRLKELREKYKNDKTRLNTETMQLFRNHKVNPMGGCLPMLIQLPIYIALYKVLWNSIELYHAPFFWFYRDLSAPDPVFAMPIILGAAMWFQQKLTPSATADPAQAKAMQLMPIMFTAFMLFLPSGLVLYILINTAMGILQQWMMNNDIRLRDLIFKKAAA